MFVDAENTALLKAIALTLPVNWHEKKLGGDKTLFEIALDDSHDNVLALIDWSSINDLEQKMWFLETARLSRLLVYFFKHHPALINEKFIVECMYHKPVDVFKVCASFLPTEKIPPDFFITLINFTLDTEKKLAFLFDSVQHLIPSHEVLKTALMIRAKSCYQKDETLNFLLQLRKEHKFSNTEISEALAVRVETYCSKEDDYQGERAALVDFLKSFCVDSDHVIDLSVLKKLIDDLRGTGRTEPRVLLMFVACITIHNAWACVLPDMLWYKIIHPVSRLHHFLSTYPYDQYIASRPGIFSITPLQRAMKNLKYIFENSTVDSLNNKGWDDFFGASVVDIPTQNAELQLEPLV